jgi:hypothetical protein
MTPIAGRLADAWAVLWGRERAPSPFILALRDDLAQAVAERDAQMRRAIVTAGAEARELQRPVRLQFEVCGCAVLVLPPESD